MRFFRREIEVALKTVGVLTLIGLIVLSLAWGYEQRRQARIWRNIACAYRIDQMTRHTRLVPQVERAPDACAVLARLGFNVDPEDVAPPSSFVVRRVASRN